VAGLKVVSPSNASDAYWMMQQAIQSDDPVIFEGRGVGVDVLSAGDRMTPDAARADGDVDEEGLRRPPSLVDRRPGRRSVRAGPPR
ncbi:hypothetical protein ABZU94_39295, partial [Streptomyces mirabilis]|uniref:hypothetical protein n=1 Tax=Streptomyces sp. NPDC005388 TaxID=3156717 RepID=UPI0033B18651